MKKGYLIPENAQPTKNRCLRVFVPDEPLYIAAFLGALTYFGQWTAWERDKEKRGQLAAAAWKDANDFTIDGLTFPCSDNPITDEEMSEILEQLADIKSQLAEINEMNVTQTVNVGGCGCCGEETTTAQTTNGIIIDPEDTGIIPPYMTENVTVIDSARCRAANWLAVTVAQMTRTMSTIGTMPVTLSNVTNVLIAILTIGNGVIWSLTAILALGYRLINGMNSDSYDYLGTVASAMDNSMQEFVCALYNWTSAENLGGMLNGAISGFVNDAKLQLSLSDTVADSIYTALIDVMGAAFVNYFVENIDTIVPADFVPLYSCLCGATGDSCPTQNITLAAIGNLPDGDLTGLTEVFASTFNSTTGYYEVIFELAENYCVTLENGVYTPTEEHEKCSGGVMVPSDGVCIRRFVARSQTPFATSVTFNSISANCSCPIIPEDPDILLVPAPFASIGNANGAAAVATVSADGLLISITENKADGRWGNMDDISIQYDLSVVPAGGSVVGMLYEIVQATHSQAVDRWDFTDIWAQNTSGTSVDEVFDVVVLGYDPYNGVPAKVADLIALSYKNIQTGTTGGIRGYTALVSQRVGSSSTSARVGTIEYRAYLIVDTS